MVYGYLRAVENCSPQKDISKQNQQKILKEQGVSNIYQDIISAKTTTGNENLNILIDGLVQNDIVIITKLSRIADSLTKLFEIYSLLSSKGIILKVLELGGLILQNENISSEKWFYAMKIFEEDIRYEKICKGHLISRKNHQSNSAIPCGKPVTYSNKQLSEALKLRDRYTLNEIVSITGISKSTLLRGSKKMQLNNT